MVKDHFQTHYAPDSASKRSYTLKKLWLSKLRVFPHRRQVKVGSKVVVGKNVVFRLTDNAIVEIGDHSVIDDFTYFILTKPSPRLVIGKHVGLGLRTMIAIKSTLTIGDHVRFGADVIIRDNYHDFKKGMVLLQTEAVIKPVIIGRAAWIGDRAIIFPGVTIGEGAIVSAGSIVTKDVPPHTLVRGQPAVVVRELS